MKIKIELDGLSLEHATEITTFLKSLSEKNQIVTSVNGSALEVQIDSVKEEKPKATRKKAEKVEAPQEAIPTESEAPQEDIPTESEAPQEAIPTESEAPQEETKPEAPQEETKPEAIEVVEPETVSAPTLMQIRSLVAQKAADHKDAIKAKLVELGAQNVSTLDAKHFQTVFDFLNEL